MTLYFYTEGERNNRRFWKARFVFVFVDDSQCMITLASPQLLSSHQSSSLSSASCFAASSNSSPFHATWIFCSRGDILLFPHLHRVLCGLTSLSKTISLVLWTLMHCKMYGPDNPLWIVIPKLISCLNRVLLTCLTPTQDWRHKKKLDCL